MCACVCVRVTLSQELSRGLIARACGQALIKFYALLPFFLNVDLVFFFSLFGKMRYVTYVTSRAPLPKCAFFSQIQHQQPASHKKSDTRARRHKQKKKRRTLYHPRARARRRRRRRRRRRKKCTRVREEDALKDAAAFFLAKMEKEEEER